MWFMLFTCIVVALSSGQSLWRHSMIKSNSRLYSNFDNLHAFTSNEKPLYTVVWYDNLYARALVNEMYEQKMKTVFIEMEELFDTKRSPFDEINRPMFYKDTKEITNWYDIYSEIYNF